MPAKTHLPEVRSVHPPALVFRGHSSRRLSQNVALHDSCSTLASVSYIVAEPILGGCLSLHQ